MKKLKLLLKWICGIVFSIIGFAVLVSDSLLGGISLLLTGLFIIPPLTAKFENLIGRTLSSKVKIGIALGLAFLGLFFIGNNQAEVEKKIIAEQETAFKKLPQHVKDSIFLAKHIEDSIQIVVEKRKVEEQRLIQIENQKKNTISARSLYENYEANEVSADQKFKNEIFYVTGVVEEIKKDFMDDIYVTLKTGQMFSYVNCYLDDEKTAAKLKKGQRVTFKGKCNGMVVTLVTMKDCEIAKNL
jgi:hypothetical protein